MLIPKSSRIPTIVRPLCRNLKALSFLLWSGPIAIVAISFLAAHEHWTLGRTKTFYLATEYFLLLPILILLLVGAYYRQRETVSLPPTLASASRSRKRLPFLVFLAMLVPLAFALDRGTYQGDENAYLFQARCLNSGALYTSPPPRIPLTAITYDHHVIYDGKWFGKYPPGWPVVLSIGTATQLAWLLNPLLGLGLLWITFHIGARSFGESAGIWSVWILAISAYYSLNCLGFMSHALSGLLVAAAVFCCLEFSKSKGPQQRRLWIVGAFLCLTGTSVVRPFSAIFVGMALIAALTIRRNWPAIVRFLLCSVLWAAVIIASIGMQNRLVTGSYLKSPYNPDGSQINAIAIRPAEIWHAFLYYTSHRVVDTASTAFPYIFLLATYGLWRRRREPFAWMLALVFLSLVVGYTIEVIDSDSPMGERYYFEGYFAIALLAAAGWLHLVKDIRLAAPIRRNAMAAVFAVSCTITAVGAYFEAGLRWPSRQLTNAADHPPIHTDLVFVQGYAWMPPWRLNFNTPGRETIFVNDPGPSQRAAFAQMAGRPNSICLYYDPVKKVAVWSKAGDKTTGPRRQVTL